MDKQELDKIAEHITSIFRTQGERAAVAERDRVNERLATQGLSFWFQGPRGGYFLGFFFHDTASKQEVHRITKMWIPRASMLRR
jgi:hypothetical protein